MSYVLTKCLCLPLEVRSNTQVRQYEYDVFGRLIGMKLPVGEVREGYDDRVNKINTIEFRNGSASRQIAKATYDELGELVKIKSSSSSLVNAVSSWSRSKEADKDGNDNDDGLMERLTSGGDTDVEQDLSISYDGKGRIATLVDEKIARTVRIGYNINGKPILVQIPGVGAITVTYKSSGEIEKVDSKDGPTVSVQIASTFNNLLDAISPFEKAVVPDTDFDLLTAEPYGCRECSRATPF